MKRLLLLGVALAVVFALASATDAGKLTPKSVQPFDADAGAGSYGDWVPVAYPGAPTTYTISYGWGPTDTAVNGQVSYFRPGNNTGVPDVEECPNGKRIQTSDGQSVVMVHFAGFPKAAHVKGNISSP